MPSARPLSIREIQEKKRKQREAEGNKVTIYNKTKNQTIPIQIYGGNSKLVAFQQTVMIYPGKKADLPKYRLNNDQIKNLKKRGLISVYNNLGSGSLKENILKIKKAEDNSRMAVESLPDKVKPRKLFKKSDGEKSS